MGPFLSYQAPDGLPVRWPGLVSSVAVHIVLVPALAAGLQHATSRARLDQPPQRSTIVYQVMTLRLPQDLLRQQPPPPPKPPPAPVARATPPAPAPKSAPKAFMAPPVPAPAKAEVVILQPPTVRADPERLKDLKLPALTMVTPAAVPRAFRNFDVGALEKRRTATKVPDPGPLPEPPPSYRA